ncbi:MAG: hypothetical protein KC635_25900 [Myxococcales bacterium]|nr:hypothetical protein [Myxococcales bacterium]
MSDAKRERRPAALSRTVGAVVGGLGAVLGGFLAVGCAVVGVSAHTFAIVLCFIGLSSVGLVELAWPRWGRRVALVALGGLVALVGARLLGGNDGTVATVAPEGGASRWVARLVPEQDGVKLMAWLQVTLGAPGVSEREYDGFLPAADREYARMHGAIGRVPSPLPATVLGLESPDAFDLLTIPATAPPSSAPRAAIFLHGAVGSWALLCWLVADALPPDTRLYCPATDGSGDWSSAAGVATVRATLTRAADDGARGVLVVGLSAGAASLDAVLDAFPEGTFTGAIYLFGGSSRPLTRAVPSLFVLGTADERFPFAALTAVAESRRRDGADITIAPIDADHFGLVKAHAEVAAAVRGWARAHPEALGVVD